MISLRRPFRRAPTSPALSTTVQPPAAVGSSLAERLEQARQQPHKPTGRVWTPEELATALITDLNGHGQPISPERATAVSRGDVQVTEADALARLLQVPPTYLTSTDPAEVEAIASLLVLLHACHITGTPVQEVPQRLRICTRGGDLAPAAWRRTAAEVILAVAAHASTNCPNESHGTSGN